MTNVMAGSLNGRFQFLPNSTELENARLEVMSVLINNICNLSCRHCYLQTKKYEQYLSHEEWQKFFRSVFSDLDLSVLCFAGKEVFANRPSVDILLNTVRLRNQLQKNNPQKTEIGVITNGTLIHKYQDLLLETAPDYFDISIDGLPDIHDSVRGKGSFAKTEQNLQWLLQQFPGQVWITHTALASNLESLPDFINHFYQQYGIDRFSIGFYKDMAYTDNSLALDDKHYRRIIKEIMPQLEDISLGSPVEVIMEFDSTESKLLDALRYSGWIKPWEEISTTEHNFSNGLTLRLNTAQVPVGLYRSVRVTPEGYWLAAEDLMRVREYQTTRVASIRESNYSASELYKAGINYLKSETYSHNKSSVAK